MKLLIFGSCVTRDALEFDLKGNVKLVGYFARSSLASAFSELPFEGVDVAALESPFQRRIVDADLQKTFPEFLCNNEFDLLVYDPIDERFNLLVNKMGCLCTLSNEFLKVGAPCCDNAERIESGTKEFFSLWEKGWVSFVKHLISLEKLSALRVNKVYWAREMEGGEEFSKNFSSVRIKKENLFLDNLYKRMAVDLNEDQFFSFKNEVLKGNPTHKWGKSPFHFVDEYYSALIKSITA